MKNVSKFVISLIVKINMEHPFFLNQIDISNFKSINNLTIKGLNRVNLIIGRPNVGKSNIIEALGLFAIPFLGLKHDLNQIVRSTKIHDLFYDSKHGFSIRLKQNDSLYSKILSGKIENDSELGLNIEFTSYPGPFPSRHINYSKNLISGLTTSSNASNFSDNQNIALNTKIKPYIFDKQKIDGSISSYSFLQPPFGQNLSEVLNANFSDLRPSVASYFEEFGLKLVIDEVQSNIFIQKENDDGTVKQLSYKLIADTLQRIIFNKAAIYSNSDSVLLFEEPEAHSFPPYISEFTNDVVNSNSNQFFIITHSPIIFQDFIERAFDDLSVLLVDFDREENSTIVKTLSKEEMEEVRDNGVDLFFNYEPYLV